MKIDHKIGQTIADEFMASGKACFSTVKHLSLLDEGATREHSHDFHHLVVCTSGCGIYWEAGREHRVQAPAVVLTPVGVSHFWVEWRDMDGYAFGFDSEMLMLFCEHKVCVDLFYGNGPKVISLSDRILNGLLPFLEKIKQEWESHSCDRTAILGSCLNLFLSDITDHLSMDRQAVDENLWVRFMQTLDEFWNRWHSPEFYAAQLNVSTDFLTKYLRQKCAKSTRECIQERVLREAKSALLKNNTTIKTLCFDLGFNDPGYFSRFFRKMTGMTPKSYRKMHLSRSCLN